MFTTRILYTYLSIMSVCQRKKKNKKYKKIKQYGTSQRYEYTLILLCRNRLHRNKKKSFLPTWEYIGFAQTSVYYTKCISTRHTYTHTHTHAHFLKCAMVYMVEIEKCRRLIPLPIDGKELTKAESDDPRCSI